MNPSSLETRSLSPCTTTGILRIGKRMTAQRRSISCCSIKRGLPTDGEVVRTTRQLSVSRFGLLFFILLARQSECFRSITFRRETHHLPRHQTSLKAASKSGAKLMESSDDFVSSVLQASSTRPVMVFYTAPWCGPCRLSTPVVKDVMKLFANQMDTVEVCTDDLPDVCADAGVVSIPTIQMYYRGKLMDTIVGCVAKSVLSSAVEKVMEDAAVQFGRRNNDAASGDQQDS